MARTRVILLALMGAAWTAGPARAGEVACHFEGGVLTAPAKVAGIAGDFVIDTGTAQTALHETAAQAAGLAPDGLTGDVILAGGRALGLPLAVQDLDVRTWNLPSAVAGVIGADVLKAWVVDISYAPCRIRLWAPGAAPGFRGAVLPLGWDQGRPTAEASVTDGAHALKGPFVLATGLNVPARLADDLAQAPGAAKPDELYPDGVWLARLAGMSFAGADGLDVAAGLMKPDGAVAGEIGGSVLSHFRLRFDFPAGRLIAEPLR